MGQIRRWVLSVIMAAVGAVFMLVLPSIEASATGSAAQVTNVRVGAHKDKTRIVLDITKPADLRYQVSADRNVVFIDLPKVNWTADQFEGRHFKGLVTDFRFSPNAKGGRFNILTNGPVQVRRPFFVRPRGKLGHRIVIDIMSDQSASTTARRIDPHSGKLHQIAYRGQRPSFNMDQRVTRHRAMANSEEPPEVDTIIPNLQNRATQIAQKTQPVPMLQQAQTKPPTRTDPLTNQNFGGILGFHNIYLKGQFGVGIIPEITNSGSGNENTMELDPGFSFTGGLGIDLENSFRVEGEMTYAFNNVRKVSGTGNGASFNTTYSDGDIASLAFMGNLAYDFPAQDRFTPYVMGGAGFVSMFTNDIRADGTVISDSSDFVFGMQIGAGVSVPLDDVTTLEAGYRYMETQDPEFGDQRGMPFNTEYSSHNFLLSARLKL